MINSIASNSKMILVILNVSSAFYTTGLIKDLNILKKGRVQRCVNGPFNQERIIDPLWKTNKLRKKSKFIPKS